MFDTYQEARKWAFENFKCLRHFSIEPDCYGRWAVFFRAEPSVAKTNSLTEVKQENTMATMTFTEYRDKAHRTSSELPGQNHFALGLAGGSGEIINAIKKAVYDIDNGCSVRESMFARRALIEEKIGDFMRYNVEFHYDCIVEAEAVIHNEREIDMEAAIDAALTLALESSTAAKYPERKDFLNVTSIVADLCTALNLNLYSIMEKNIKKLESRYPDGFVTGVK